MTPQQTIDANRISLVASNLEKYFKASEMTTDIATDLGTLNLRGNKRRSELIEELRHSLTIMKEWSPIPKTREASDDKLLMKILRNIYWNGSPERIKNIETALAIQVGIPQEELVKKITDIGNLGDRKPSELLQEIC